MSSQRHHLPGIGLQTSNLPSLSEDPTSSTMSPARGPEMRNEVLKKLRVPQFIHVWDFWHARPSPTSPQPTLNNLSAPDGIRTIKDLWEYYNNTPLSNLHDKDTLALFHHGVKPEWEDPRNQRGGSWTFRVRAALAPEFWRQLVVMATGEILQEAVRTHRVSFNDDLCGITYSPRGRLVKIGIWNRDAGNEDGKEKLRRCVEENMPKELMPDAGNMFVYYKRHEDEAEFGKVAGSAQRA